MLLNAKGDNLLIILFSWKRRSNFCNNEKWKLAFRNELIKWICIGNKIKYYNSLYYHTIFALVFEQRRLKRQNIHRSVHDFVSIPCKPPEFFLLNTNTSIIPKTALLEIHPHRSLYPSQKPTFCWKTFVWGQKTNNPQKWSFTQMSPALVLVLCTWKKKKNLTLSLLNITAREAATEIQQREKVR